MSSIWDVQITGNESAPDDYPVAKPGIYDFEITNAKLVEFKPKPGSKIPNCAEIDVTLKFKGIADDGRDVTVFDRIYFAESTIWKATQLAKCADFFLPGLTPKEYAERCYAECGTAELEIHEYNGNKSNRVKKYIVKKQEVPNNNPVDSSELPF